MTGPYDAAPDRTAQYHKGPKGPRRPRLRADSAHIPQICGEHIVCWRCCRAAKCTTNLNRHPCLQAGDSAHKIWTLGSHFFCSRCGARTQERVRLLKKECKGHPGSATQARMLKRLKMGIPPTSGLVAPGSRPVPCEMVFPGGSTSSVQGGICDDPQLVTLTEALAAAWPQVDHADHGPQAPQPG
jgi:hypothetical protein